MVLCIYFNYPPGIQDSVHDVWYSFLGREKAWVVGFPIKAGAPIPNESGNKVVGVIPDYFIEVKDANHRIFDIGIPYEIYNLHLLNIGQLVWIKENNGVALLEP